MGHEAPGAQHPAGDRADPPRPGRAARGQLSAAGQSTALALPVRTRPDAHAAAGARRVLAGLSLAGLLVCSALIVSSATAHPSMLVPARFGGLPDWLRGPWRGPGYSLLAPDFALVMAVMTACYLIALVTVSALRVRSLLVVVVVLHVIFLAGPPLISSDAFGYLDWARMGVLHGLNPYATASGAVVSDPVYGFVRWTSLTSPYGPLFTLGTYALVPLGVPGSYWALKLVVTASSLGCLALIWRCALLRGASPMLGVALYGLNPALLAYTVGGFHNDTIVMVAVMAAVYLAITAREGWGAVTTAVAVALKSSAGLVVPFLVVGARDRVRGLVGAVAAGVAVLAVALLTFGWQAFGFIDVLGTQQTLNSGSSVPAQLGAWFGWSGSPPAVRAVASIIAVIAVGGLLRRTWRGADWVESAGWATLAVLVTSSWLLAWYIVWLLPLAAISRGRMLPLAAVAMTLFVILVRAAPNLG